MPTDYAFNLLQSCGYNMVLFCACNLVLLCAYLCPVECMVYNATMHANIHAYLNIHTLTYI
jgi:hypothetical protein